MKHKFPSAMKDKLGLVHLILAAMVANPISDSTKETFVNSINNKFSRDIKSNEKLSSATMLL
ncbi:MAG: hypothetical protein SFW35_11365 [Chitinophagales bacterium]|nr:hypothetical protein [Chitinophagales bacterium]